jgi:hypothetical protein
MSFKKITIVAFIIFILSACSSNNDNNHNGVDIADIGMDIVESAEDSGVFIDGNSFNENGDTEVSEEAQDAELSEVGIGDDGGSVQNRLYIAMILQLEDSSIVDNKNLYENYVANLTKYVNIFEKYNAKLSIEARQIVQAIQKYGNNVLLDFSKRGHSVNLRAGSGVGAGMTFSDFVQDLRDKKEAMESISISPIAVSGVCSQLDWVAASFNVGFKYITSITAYCLKSLPLEEQPDFVKNCLAPNDCNQVYPFEFEQRLSPWYAGLGVDWRRDDEDGRVVIMPSFAPLNCVDEEYKNPSGRLSLCPFDNFDIERSLDIIDRALTMLKPDRLNVVIFSLNYGQQVDEALLEKWLSEVSVYVKKGKIEWRNTDEIYNEYILGK